MAGSYILFRQGKTPVGPFITIEAATNYIANKKLLGFAVLPMSMPELGGVQNVVGSGPKVTRHFNNSVEADDFVRGMRETFVWSTSDLMIHNCRSFLQAVVDIAPKVGKYKIQCIKHLRQLAQDNSYDLGLRDAKQIADDFFGKNGE